MERPLWAPWRMEFIDAPKPAGCIFCSFPSEEGEAADRRNLVAHRSARSFTLLNRFPYNSGHLMVVPYRATSRVEDLTGEEMHEIMETSQRAFRALRKLMNPDGFNFGANIGRAAGAGIDNHIHFHIVPRWNGDTNFMPLLADVKVVSEDTVKTMKKLRKFF